MRFDHATKISSRSPLSLYSCLVAAFLLGVGLASESDDSEEARSPLAQAAVSAQNPCEERYECA